MFESLSERLSGILDKLTRRGALSEEDVGAAMREVRRALLEADVPVSVAKEFVARVEQRAVGEEVLKSLQPGQQVVGIVHDELVALLGDAPVTLAGSPFVPTVVLLAGLQGSGKTTFAGKLARWLKQRSKRTLLVSADVHRPAAIDQLERVATSAEALFWRAETGTSARDIAAGALEQARVRGADFLILDTAGRLQIDDALMTELADLKRIVRAHQVVLVVDGMIGQESVRVGQVFAERIGIDGLVLSKMDGDARGGAALSLRQVTGKPILFLGVGERLDGLEAFDARRLAGRILGMGDVVGLVERAQQAVSADEAAALAERMKKSEFTLDDFLAQIRGVRKLGPLEDIMKMLPGVPKQALEQVGSSKDTFKRFEAILLSMTPKERRVPKVLDGSRRKRIAAGSGTTVTEVNQLLRQFDQAKVMMKALKKGPRGLAGLRGRMR